MKNCQVCSNEILGVGELYCSMKCYGTSRKGIIPKSFQEHIDYMKENGRIFSEEHCKNISIGKTGKKFTEEHKENLSIAHLGQEAWNKNLPKELQPKYGYQTPEITCKKIANSNKKWFEENKNTQTYDKRMNTISLLGKQSAGTKLSEERKLQQREGRIKYIEKTNYNGMPLIPCIGKYEKKSIDFLELATGYKFIRQYKIDGYFIDGYCPTLKLAVEIDEKFHKNKIDKDLERQKYIENKLGCTFLRINVGGD